MTCVNSNGTVCVILGAAARAKVFWISLWPVAGVVQRWDGRESLDGGGSVVLRSSPLRQPYGGDPGLVA